MAAKLKQEFRLVRLELSSDDHARLRVLAAQDGLPMSKKARQIVEEKIREKGKNSSKSA